MEQAATENAVLVEEDVEKKDSLHSVEESLAALEEKNRDPWAMEQPTRSLDLLSIIRTRLEQGPCLLTEEDEMVVAKAIFSLSRSHSPDTWDYEMIPLLSYIRIWKV
ncbi:MAG: hypothetical protein NUV59_04485 [Patescibacteria group bacterium]|nr:hypothetical protein [Patescibacteria group bacterium]